MKTSIVIPTFDKISHLDRVLRSIRIQTPPFDYEVIVVNDGPNPLTESVATRWNARHFCTYNTAPRNPAAAYNLGYKQARGEVIISTKDDVVQVTPDAIERLVLDFPAGRYRLAKVCQGERVFVSSERQRPLMFLGAVLRKDVYAIGGCEEQFGSHLGYDDNYFAACLAGLGLTPVYMDDVAGEHLWHPRPANLESEQYKAAEAIYQRRLKECQDARTQPISSGGPWRYG